MRPASLWHLVRLSLARDVRGALSSAFGVAMGVGTLVFFVGLGLGVGRIVREQIFPVEARLVQVVAPAVSVGSLLGGGALDEAAVERLAALPAVAAGPPADERARAGGEPLRWRLLRPEAALRRGAAGGGRGALAVRRRRA